MNIKKLVKVLKENDQDLNFYPTTDEIIEVLYKDIKKEDSVFSMLDIGAGNGKVFTMLEKLKKEKDTFCIGKKYAIEKSKILIESMDKDIFIIGTDFYEQTLIEKKVDIIFSNPPYSDYLRWTEKIIKEANSKYIYLVLPQRWEAQQNLKSVIKLRDAEYKIIGNFDFENAERKARAKVHLIKISLSDGRYNYNLKKDPFDLWFDETFKFKADKIKEHDYDKERKKAEELKSIVSKKSLILTLEKLYKTELDNIIKNYRLLEQMDGSLFRELNVNIQEIKEGLKLRIKNLKNLYWKELFDNLEVITNRLTQKSRTNLLDTLMENTTVDFTASNAYSIIIWTIKNANKYYDKQLLKMYLELSSRDNVKLYKSNHRIIEDGWRYEKDKMSHYSLDYRIVHNYYNAIVSDTWHNGNGMSRDAQNFIQDIFTIAKNLGFDVVRKPSDYQWEAGKRNKFYVRKGDVYEKFVEIKAFKNGNLHFKFIPRFMKKFNLEAARLNGWIKSPKEAAKEFDIGVIEATEMFKGNFYIGMNETNNLLGWSEQK